MLLRQIRPPFSVEAAFFRRGLVGEGSVSRPPNRWPPAPPRFVGYAEQLAICSPSTRSPLRCSNEVAEHESAGTKAATVLALGPRSDEHCSPLTFGAQYAVSAVAHHYRYFAAKNTEEIAWCSIVSRDAITEYFDWYATPIVEDLDDATRREIIAIDWVRSAVDAVRDSKTIRGPRPAGHGTIRG